MPRIDPFELLKCLSVLLSQEGGISTREEVPRLVNLMAKFSKKLVSKCVYLLILKSTDIALVDMFMTSGGWLLIHTWLQEAMANSNWNFVQEVLELLLITPVDSTRLRLNNIPKLVKTLSKREDLGDVKEMAASLVNNWLAIVKNSTPAIQEEKLVKSPEVTNEVMVHEEKKEQPPVEPPVVTNEIETIELPEPPAVEEEPAKMEVEDENTNSTSMVYKITVRDGKQVLTKLVTSEEVDDKTVVEESKAPEESIEKKDTTPKIEDETKKESKSKSSSNNKSSSSSSSKKSSSSSKSSSNSKDKDRKSSSKHSSRSSSSSSRDKDRKKDKENDKDKHRSNGSSKHSSSSSGRSSSSSSRSKDRKDSKESKEKQAEKDKDTLEKLKPVTLDKIGRIPKKSSTEEKDKEVKKKPSMSIEPKKKAEDRPKTVKIFNSKMRSTGLEEEAKPPPPRSAVKKPSAVIPPINLPTKRPSPPKDSLSVPPEKKMKLEIPERIGAIKLIPPKPKPAFLQESDIFMDALTAASSKKEPKKKKRRLSQSKEPEEPSPTVQQPSTSPPIGIKNCTPANFYQETLDSTNETEETKEDTTDDPMEGNKDVESSKEATSEEKDNNNTKSENTSEVNEPSTRTNSDGLKGALVYFKKKGPKRSIRWKDDKDLVDVRYFELDETERVNVSRPNFTELAKLDMTHEREALLGRKLNNEDLMEPSTVWRVPHLVDQPDLPVQPGSKSLEKDIQYARSKNTLQALYFNKNMIPDTPGEPVPEIHPMVDPVTIPLEDADSQVCDLRNTPWPEPKGMAPVEQPPVMPPMFPNMPGPFPNFPQMGPQGFPGMQGPRFGPPNMMQNGPPNMMPNNMNMMGNPNMNMGPPVDMMNQGPMNTGPMNQGPMGQGPMNPNMFGPNGPNMDGYNPMMNENQNYPLPFNQPNMYGPPNNNFNNMERGGVHRGRGAFRRGHNNWNRNVPRGGSSWRGNSDHRGGRMCKNVKNHGYCRKMDTCPFIHPN